MNVWNIWLKTDNRLVWISAIKYKFTVVITNYKIIVCPKFLILWQTVFTNNMSCFIIFRTVHYRNEVQNTFSVFKSSRYYTYSFILKIILLPLCHLSLKGCRVNAILSAFLSSIFIYQNFYKVSRRD